MCILDLAEIVAKEANFGVPVSVYRGGGHKELDPEKPFVFITLADIPADYLPADTAAYSWLDFAHEPVEHIIYTPWINVIPNHRHGGIARRLNWVMEEVGRRMGFTSIRVYTQMVINGKLRMLLPHFGYAISGTDEIGEYLEKKI